MQSLRAIAQQLRPLGRNAAFYLAAAVSDFYIPWPQMVRALPLRAGHRQSSQLCIGCFGSTVMQVYKPSLFGLSCSATLYRRLASTLMCGPQVEHKIQSAEFGEGFHLELQKVQSPSHDAAR